MGQRLPLLLPRLAVLALLALLATAGLTYAAGGAPSTASTTTATTTHQQPLTVVVPDVRKEAFVFAKGQLEDAGFAWRIAGSVRGYSPNTVVSESPAPGTKLVDTGAPPVTLTLARNPSYPQSGEPEDVSPYPATALRLAASAPAAPATTTAPAAATTAPPVPTTTPTTTTAPPAAAPERAVTRRAGYPQHRPPAFVVPGAKKEPLDEMPLPDRAAKLGDWLAGRPQPTNANVRYWLYQNAWVVAGARMGWWRGAQALRTLVTVDARAESLWGIGAQTRAIARQALTEVEARSR